MGRLGRARLSKIDAAGGGAGRRPASPEAVPGEPPVEVGDFVERAEALRPPEEDLVRGAAIPCAVRAIAVVPELEIGGEAIELADRGNEPGEIRDGLFEGAEDALDAAVSPGVSGLGAHVPHAVAAEASLELDRAECGRSVGEYPLRRSVGEEPFEDACHVRCAPSRDALEGHHAAAVIVDYAEDPDREDPQDADGCQVETPELARPGDLDLAGTTSDLVFEGGDEVAATGEDASEGLLRCLEPEHAGSEMLQLPFAELRLCDVEPHDRVFDGIGRSVPGARSVGSTPGRDAGKCEAGAPKPLPPEASESATDPASTTGYPIPSILDRDGSAK